MKENLHIIDLDEAVEDIEEDLNPETVSEPLKMKIEETDLLNLNITFENSNTYFSVIVSKETFMEACENSGIDFEET